jgi:DNA replication protein DnaC
MHLEQTLSQLRAMRLAVMATALDRRSHETDSAELSNQDFVSLLVQEEYTARQSRKLSRLIGTANFKPEQACLENIHYEPSRGFQRKDLAIFTSPGWIANAQNVIITGPTGTGKTYLAEAIGLQACQMGFSAKKVRYKRLFEEISAARGTGLYLKHQESLARIKVLIIDDFVMEPIQTMELAELMEIIEDRSQRVPTILTTQYPMDKWHAMLPDPTIADAICDRLINTAIKLNLKGDSLRQTKKAA